MGGYVDRKMLVNSDEQEVGTPTNPFYTKQDKNGNQTFTIPNGGQVPAVGIDVGGKSLFTLLVPAAYSGGNLTVQVADTLAGSYKDLYDATGAAVTITVGGADRAIAITGTPLQALAGVRFVKFKSASAVTADRTFTLIAKE